MDTTSGETSATGQDNRSASQRLSADMKAVADGLKESSTEVAVDTGAGAVLLPTAVGGAGVTPEIAETAETAATAADVTVNVIRGASLSSASVDAAAEIATDVVAGGFDSAAEIATSIAAGAAKVVTDAASEAVGALIDAAL